MIANAKDAASKQRCFLNCMQIGRALYELARLFLLCSFPFFPRYTKRISFIAQVMFWPESVTSCRWPNRSTPVMVARMGWPPTI